MNPANFIQELPDLVLVLRRDGTLLSWTGGDALPKLREVLTAGGAWSEPTAKALSQLARTCISRRSPVDAQLQEAGVDCDVRASPQGPDRAVCTLRPALPKVTDNTADETGLQRRPGLERRGFTRQLRDRLARAALSEQPLAVAVLHIDGLPGIAQTIGSRIADRVLNAALKCIPPPESDRSSARELLGQLGENVLALVVESADRRLIESRVAELSDAIRSPHDVEGMQFRLTCSTGIAMLGDEGATPTQLLDRASAAAMEARRVGQHEPRFHTDTVQVRSLERIDLVRELHDAVSRREVGLRFAARHDLASGGLAARVAYLHWPHPLRGEIRPAEFLNIAESTGFGAALSRAALATLCAEFSQHTLGFSPNVRMSFGPLRDHVLEHSFAEDVLRQLDEHGVAAERFELRIAERAFVARESNDLRPLQDRGVRIVVDEVGRNASSLATLAQAPLWGLQLDRSWAAASASDFAARSVCRAVAALAAAFGLEALATGIDDERRRDVMCELGYRYGSGDLYPTSKART